MHLKKINGRNLWTLNQYGKFCYNIITYNNMIIFFFKDVKKSCGIPSRLGGFLKKIGGDDKFNPCFNFRGGDEVSNPV